MGKGNFLMVFTELYRSLECVVWKVITKAYSWRIENAPNSWTVSQQTKSTWQR